MHVYRSSQLDILVRYLTAIYGLEQAAGQASTCSADWKAASERSSCAFATARMASTSSPVLAMSVLYVRLV